MKIVLVTGANGFVGSALYRELRVRGYAVRGAVRRPGGRSSLYPGPLPEGDGEIAEVGDVGPETDWSAALDQVDCVVHLAARVHVMKDAAADPLAEFRRTNTAATERLARCAVAAGAKRLVFVSTIKVNGEETRDKSFTESDSAHPGDPYGISKWEAEQVLARVSAETGLEVVILRPPLIYGPGVKGNFLTLLNVVMRGIPLPLAAVDNKRSLLYLGNAVDALILATTHPEAAGKTFLLSDGQDVSSPELVLKLAKELDAPGRLLHCPRPLLRLGGRMLGKADAVSRLVESLQVDSSALRRELGWEPPFSLEDGLKATAEWYRSVCEKAVGADG
jgi:nucleoside-diphosphate-sugar epimerase